MNEEVRELWLKELESDNYVFGRGVLVTDEGTHCALGVLSELAHQRGIISRATVTQTDPFNNYNVGEDEWTKGSLVPESMRKWAGLTIEQTYSIAKRNDEKIDDPFMPNRSGYKPVIDLLKILP